MGNVILVDVKMKDGVSSPSKIATKNVYALNKSATMFTKTSIVGMSKATKATNAFSGSVKKSTKNIGMTGKSIGDLDARLNRLKKRQSIQVDVKGIKRTNKEISQVERRLNKLKSTGSRGLFRSSGGGGNLISQMVPLGGAYLAGAAIRKTLMLGFEREQTKISFETMIGDKGVAKDLIQDINEFAKNTPLLPKGLEKGAKTLMAFNVDAKKVIPTLKMLGDVSLGDKGRMDSLTLAFAQSRSAGRLMGQDLLQMVAAGFNPLQTISKKTGISMFQLKKRMEDGAISSKMVEAAFQLATSAGGKFHNALKNQSESAWGKFNILVGGLQLKLAKFSEKYVLPIASSLIDVAIVVMDNIEVITALGGAMAALYTAGSIAKLGGIVSAIKSIGIVAKITTGYQWLLNAAMSANPVGLIVAGVAALAATMAWAWNNFEGFRGVIVGGWEAMKSFAGIISDVVLGNIKALIDGVSGLGDAMGFLKQGEFGKAFDSASSAAEKVMKGMKLFNPIALGYDVYSETKKRSGEVGEDYDKGHQKGVDSKFRFGFGKAAAATKAVANVDGIKVNDNVFDSLKGGASKDTKDKVNGTVTGGRRSVNISLFENATVFKDTNIDNSSSGQSTDDLFEMIVSKIMNASNEAGVQLATIGQRV